MRITYIDAICGAGKTEAAVRHVIRRVRELDDKFVLMMPTVRLIEQTEMRFEDLGYTGPLTAIHNENSDESVVKRIHSFFDQLEPSGVLIITVAAWRRVKGRNLEDWYLIVDETPQVFHVSSIKSKSIRDRILPHLEVAPVADSPYSEVTVRAGSKMAIRSLLDESRVDSAIRCLEETAEHLYLGSKSYVASKTFETYSSGQATSIKFYHVIPRTFFKGFRRVIIMGANFTHSELYQLWKHWGARFKKEIGFRDEPPMPSVHPEAVGKTLDIYFLCDDYSAQFKAKHMPILESEFKRAVAEVFEEREFIYTLNKSDNPRLLAGFPNGTHVDPKAHGQNGFRCIDCVAVFAHFNLSNDQAAFLGFLFGLEYKSVWDLRNRDIYYQFVCRTSLRELPAAGSEVSPKKIVLMDKNMALWLQIHFPGSRVHKFPSDSIAALPVTQAGRPKSSSAKSGAQRARESREKKKSLKDERKLEILRRLAVHGSRNGNTLEGEPVTLIREEKNGPYHHWAA